MARPPSSRAGSGTATNRIPGRPSITLGQSTETKGVAVGVSRYFGSDRASVEREYHNVFLCRFDAEGRCREFTEIYARRGD